MISRCVRGDSVHQWMVDFATDGEVIGGSTSVNVMDSAMAH